MLKRRLPPLLACCVVLPLAAGGCRDQTAARQAELQKKITTATVHLGEAELALTTAGENAAEDARQALQRVISEIGNASDGTKGQQAAASLLTAVAHRRLASIALDRATEIEIDHGHQLAVLRQQIDAALRLEALAAGRAAVGTESERAFLETQRAAARERLSDHSERLAELDGPIATREQQNRADSERVAELEREARELRREANALGPADGFQKFRTAIDLEREADSHEKEIGIRDIALQLELKPEHDLASAQVNHLQSMLEEIRRTEESLTEFEQLTNEQVRETRQVVSQFGDEIARTLADLNDQRAGDLAESYGDATEHLDRAIADAKRAVANSSGDSKRAARLAIAQAQELKGRVHLMRSRGLIDLQETLQRAGALLSQSPVSISDVERRREEAVEASREALDAAQQTLEGLGSGASNGNESASLRRSVDISFAALEGRTVAPAPGGLGAPKLTLGAGSSSHYKHNPTGAASPQDIADALKSADGLDDARTIINFIPPIDEIPTLTPIERAVMETGLGVVVNLADLDAALMDRFGSGLAAVAEDLAPAEGAGSGMSGMGPMGGMPAPEDVPSITDVKVSATEGDRSVLLVAIEQGGSRRPLTIPLARTNGQWFFDFNEQLMNMLKQLPSGGEMGSPPGGEMSAEEQAMADAMGNAMLSGILDTINNIINPLVQELTSNVESGEYASLDAFESDVQRRIEQMMEQMFGGFEMGDMEMPEGMEGFPSPPPGVPEK